jgi:hypothetical protein
MNEDNLLWLQKWYYSYCNGDWEHENIINIVTIDNPGWSLTINLENTDLQDKKFNKLNLERNVDNWLFCQIKNNKFEGRCGPVNLSEVIQIFRNWVEDNEKENLNK